MNDDVISILFFLTAEKELSELQSAASLSDNLNHYSGDLNHKDKYKTTSVTHGNEENDITKDSKNGYQFDNSPFYATVEAVDKDYSGIAYNSPTPVLSKKQFWV